MHKAEINKPKTEGNNSLKSSLSIEMREFCPKNPAQVSVYCTPYCNKGVTL